MLFIAGTAVGPESHLWGGPGGGQRWVREASGGRANAQGCGAQSRKAEFSTPWAVHVEHKTCHPFWGTAGMSALAGTESPPPPKSSLYKGKAGECGLNNHIFRKQPPGEAGQEREALCGVQTHAFAFAQKTVKTKRAAVSLSGLSCSRIL